MYLNHAVQPRVVVVRLAWDGLHDSDMGFDRMCMHMQAVHMAACGCHGMVVAHGGSLLLIVFLLPCQVMLYVAAQVYHTAPSLIARYMMLHELALHYNIVEMAFDSHSYTTTLRHQCSA